MNEELPFRQTSIAITMAPASMLLSTRSATALGTSYPMSRSDVISRAAEGMTVVLRDIEALLGRSDLRRGDDAAASDTSLSQRALMAPWLLGTADECAEIEKRTV